MSDEGITTDRTSTNKTTSTKAAKSESSRESSTTSASAVLPKDKKRQRQNIAMKILLEAAPRIPKVTAVLLDFFVKRESGTSLSRTPLTHLCREQCVLATSEIHRRLTKERLTYIEFREGFENLLVLHDLILQRDRIAGVELAQMVKKIMVIVCELAASIERCSEVPITDWAAVGDNVLMKAQADQAKQPPLTDYIPRLAHFQCTKLLGAGGFGAVYRATYLPANYVLSLKIIPSERFSKTQQAAIDKVVASMVRSPFVIKYFSCFATREAYITLMEYVSGTDLITVANKIGHFSNTRLLPIAAQMVVGLEHMHLKGFIHRDVKISNVLIVPGGRIKLIDFDTVKICIGHYPRTVLRTFFRRTPYEFFDTETAGTLPYIAPELFRGKPYGRSCDWWSYGIMLYKMALGRLPFRARNKAELKKQVLGSKLHFHASHQIKADFSSECELFIAQLLKKNAIDRLGSKRYRDFYAHPFLQSISVKELSASIDLVNIPEIVELQQAGASDSGDKSEGVGSVVMAPTSSKRAHFKIEDLHDAEAEMHKPLMSFTSLRFRALMDKISEAGGGTVEIGESFMKEDDSFIELDARNTDFDTIFLMSQTQSLHQDNKKEVKGPETFDVILTRQRSFGIYWSFGFDIEPTKNDQGDDQYVITSIKKDSPAALARAIVGDIVVALNGTKITGLSHKIVENIISGSGDRLVLTVLVRNPFRLLVMRRDLCKLIKESVRYSLEVAGSKKSWVSSIRWYGFDWDELRMWNEDIQAYVRVHIVTRVYPDIVIMGSGAGLRMFMGDVITAVEDHDTSVLPLPKIVEFMKAARGGIFRLTIAPLSALRKSQN